MSAECSKCHRTLHDGDLAWASDWNVIEPDGLRLEIRLTCDECMTANA